MGEVVRLIGQLVCTGCGASLQTEHTDQLGYITASGLERENPLCQRCFRIRNYGEFSRVVVPVEHYEQEVSQIVKQPGLVLYVMDVFDLSGSFISELHRYVGTSHVVVVVNKVDLLPREVQYENLRDWVLNEVQRTGIQPVGVVFVSGKQGSGFADVFDAVDRYDLGPVYVVGMSNVGKSTLLNALRQRAGDAGERFTASRIPGTTLNFTAADLTLSDGRVRTIIDTPGLIHGNRVTDMLCADCLKIAVPQSRIRPRVYQLNPEQSLWLGGFARFDFIKGIRQSVVCYVSNDLSVHRTKLEKAEFIGEEHAEDILKVPCASCRREFGDLKRTPVATRQYSQELNNNRHSIVIHRSGCDIVLPGLGWIALSGSEFYGAVAMLSPIPVKHRPRLVGELSRTPRSPERMGSKMPRRQARSRQY